VKFRVLFISLIVFFVFRSGFSQDNDFGIWYGINSEIKVNKKIGIDLSAMLRTFKNASKSEQAYLEAGISYKFNKFLSVAGLYRFTNNIENDNRFHIRHKFLSDIKGTLPLNDFTFSARVRLQVQTRTYFEPGDDKTPDLTGRIKIKGIYNIPKFPVNPYLSFESFSPMFENSSRLLGKERIAVGFECKIVKKHTIATEYIFERDFIPRISDISIISVTYNVKF
jgi:hypothetical protein